MSGEGAARQAEIEARVLGEVSEDLRDVIGEEYAVDMEITMETTFSHDLELESIEFVALADRLRERYGAAVDFVGFLATMDVDQVINMRVGEVVRFIVDSLPTPATAGSA
ncbi:NADH:flavin oxidoreductase [Frankia canadensis]|uniref:NADH:flavin oxidoreductase n=1 Tax=Frankia canadensis TaxID=1836972 RepID=A0A2I2KVW9_9ACTN|nr:phosphopantetheine-binding protein [Frankia canadensis]SNQ49809.1 NADH:flavin oxidoreductase [Frankia canadensis]SOU57099.1 NADH:flavin oxidoreductase [Frankia canadensis]